MVKKVKLTTTHVVYVVELDKEIIYVGSGINGREQHCISGCSNVFGLNDLYFKNIRPTVTVVQRTNSRNEAVLKEVELITKYKPKFNKMHNPYHGPKFKKDLISKWEKYFKTLGPAKERRYKKLLTTLLKNYQLTVLVSERGVDFSKMTLEEIKKNFNCIHVLLKSKTNLREYEEHHREFYDLFVKEEWLVVIPTVTPICIEPTITNSEKEI